jgi:hypothetical protein
MKEGKEKRRKGGKEERRKGGCPPARRWRKRCIS